MDKASKGLSPVELKALDVYIQWLNGFLEVGEDVVGRAEFFEWGETFHKATVEGDWYTLDVFSAGTGDDGGPAVVYVWHDEGEIEMILQEFDTMFSIVQPGDGVEVWGT